MCRRCGLKNRKLHVDGAAQSILCSLHNCLMHRWVSMNSASNAVSVYAQHLCQRRLAWDYVLDESGSMEDISLEKIERSIERINSRGYHLPMDAVEFLRKNRLLREDKLTFAAEMLFAKEWHMNTAVQMGFFQSPTIIRDRDEAHGDLVSQVDQVFNFVKKHINCAVVISGKPENDLAPPRSFPTNCIPACWPRPATRSKHKRPPVRVVFSI